MKRLFTFIACVMLSTSMMMAQSSTEAAARKDLAQKAMKMARKDAKKYQKEGWEVSPGALPMERQLDRSYTMQAELADDGQPLYFYGEARSIGETYDAAKMQANELAKMDLAGKLENEVTALVESSVANKQLANDEAASLVQTTMEAKSILTKRLGRTLNVVEINRKLANGNREVLVRMYYNSKNALAIMKEAIREQLEGDSERLRDLVDELIK